VAAIANAGRHGVLVKSAVVMEKFAQVDLVAFDKTGTLTEAPRVAEIDLVAGSDMPVETAVAWAAAARQPSENPIARAVVAAAAERRIRIPLAEGFSSTPGARSHRNGPWMPGQRGLPGPPPTAARSAETRGVQALVNTAEEAGRTAIVVLVDDTPVAVFAVADRLRPGARVTTSPTGRASAGDNSASTKPGA
jgi:cation-transporting P-type ATPase J